MKARKSLICIALSTIACVGLHAQKLRVGPAAGMTVSAITNANSKIGWTVGIQGEWNIKEAEKGAFLSFGAMLTEKGYKSDTFFDISTGMDYTWKARPTYLEIPVHAGYRLPLGSKVNIFADAGPYLGIGLFGKTRRTETLAGTSTSTMTSYNVFDQYHRVDVGLGLRLGTELCGHYRLTAGYDWGLTNIRDNAPGLSKIRNRNFTLTLGYMF